MSSADKDALLEAMRLFIKSSASIATNTFLETPDLNVNNTTLYDAMVVSMNTFCATNNVRGLVTLPDGTVMYDTNKRANNTVANAISKTINENHNTRIVLQKANLGAPGQYQFEGKYSTTDGQFESYVAVALGSDGTTSFGCVRLSIVSLN
jgi:hypothetical protein